MNALFLLATSHQPIQELRFLYRDGQTAVEARVKEGKLSTVKTPSFNFPNATVEDKGAKFSAVTTFGGNGPQIDILGLGGKHSKLGPLQIGKDATYLSTISSDGMYLMISSGRDIGDLNTSIYKYLNGKTDLACSVPGRAIDVIDGQVLTAQSGQAIRAFDIGKKQYVVSGLVKNVQTVYAVRASLSKSDPFRDSPPGNMPLTRGEHSYMLRVSRSGTYWFEGDFRVFRSEGKHDANPFFGGHVVLSSKGVVWQWKYNHPGLNGSYFVNDHIFRFLQNDRFMMGKSHLTWMGPGVYEVDLAKGSFVRLKTLPFSTDDLVRKNMYLTN